MEFKTSASTSFAMTSFNVLDLKLSTHPRDLVLARLAATTGGDGAAVAGGGVASFVEGLTLLTAQDVLNSTLLAQLSASAQYDRFEQTIQWYQYYTNVLQGVGWAAKVFSFDERELPVDPTTVDQVVLDYMATYVNPAQHTLMQRTVNGLRDTGDNRRPVSIFVTSSVDLKEKQSNFQFGACEENVSTNTVSFSIGAFSYDILATKLGNARIEHTLLTRLAKGSAKFLSAFQVMSLKRADYDPYRDQVLQKLSGHAQDMISSIVLPSS